MRHDSLTTSLIQRRLAFLDNNHGKTLLSGEDGRRHSGGTTTDNSNVISHVWLQGK